MVSPVGKSSFKEEEPSKPKEKVVEPVHSQSVPPKEVTAKTAAEALALEREPVAVLENAINKFRNVYEQIEDKAFVRSCLLTGLWEIAFFFQHTDDAARRQRCIKNEMEIAMWSGPTSHLGCCESLLYGCYGLYIPADWRSQVKELMAAQKALTTAQALLMRWEMVELLNPRLFCRLCNPLALANKEGKEETCEDNESTDSDSYSAY